jgi:hypothetical protein
MKYVPVENEYLLSVVIGISDVISASLFKILVIFATAKRIIGVSYFLMTIIAMVFALCLHLQVELTDSIKLIYTFFIFGLRLTSGTGFMMSYFANNHYFPPLYRASIFAITNVASRLSTIFAPIVAESMRNPSITISVAGALATGTIMLLNDNNEKVET